MHINGWLRLWILASFVWALVIGLYTFFVLTSLDNPPDGDLLRTMALVWSVSSGALLAVGYGFAWVVRGFRRAGVR